MVAGGVLWAYVIGSLTRIMTKHNHDANFKDVMDELNYMVWYMVWYGMVKVVRC